MQVNPTLTPDFTPSLIFEPQRSAISLKLTFWMETRPATGGLTFWGKLSRDQGFSNKFLDVRLVLFIVVQILYSVYNGIPKASRILN